MRAKFTAVCAAALLLVGTSAYAQQEGSNDEASTTCDFTFTTGAGQKFISYCVSGHGNLMSFQSPAGVESIRLGSFLEGYAVCSNLGVHGWDGGSAGESAWGAASVTGLTGSGVQINRNTVDGRFQIQMKFSRDAAEKDVTIQVTIVNLTAVTQTNVQYSRYVDFDLGNLWDRTLDTGWSNQGSSGYAVTLGATTPEIPHSTQIESFNDLFSTSSDTCAAAVPLATPTTGDNTVRITYNVGNINPGAKKIVKYTVRRN